jgi:hypothetical protein
VIEDADERIGTQEDLVVLIFLQLSGSTLQPPARSALQPMVREGRMMWK